MTAKTEKTEKPEDQITQLKAQLQEQADLSMIWQEKWQECENVNIMARREIKRLQRQVSAAQEKDKKDV